jgi:branched-chain amino acid transport system substrate-binding protein
MINPRLATTCTRRSLVLGGAAAAMGLGRPARAANPGVSDSQVLFGHTGILSGPLGAPVKTVLAGAKLALDAANARGGVAGRKVELSLRDDELVPAKALANVQALLREQQVFGFFCNVGSGTTAAVAPELAASGAPLIGGFAVADSARSKVKGSGYYLRATSGREIQVLVQQVQTIGIRRLAITQLDNPGGAEVAALFSAAVKEAGIEGVASVPLKGDGSDAEAAAQALVQAQPQAVLMYASGSVAGNLMKACLARSFHPSFYGLSIVPGETMAKMLGDQVRGLAISQVTPYPWSGAESVAIEYRALSEKAAQPVGYLGFEGYLNGLLLLEALRRCGRELSRDKMHAVMRNLKLRLGGMLLDFTEGGATGSNYVDLVQVKADGRFIR